MVKCCKFVVEDDCCKCKLCGFVICNGKLPIHRQCNVVDGQAISNQKTGTKLKGILKNLLGIESTLACSCTIMAQKMDLLGPDWCETNEGMEEILSVMRDEHAKRWADGRTILPWTDFAAKQLVLLACRRARASG